MIPGLPWFGAIYEASVLVDTKVWKGQSSFMSWKAFLLMWPGQSILKGLEKPTTRHYKINKR